MHTSATAAEASLRRMTLAVSQCRIWQRYLPEDDNHLKSFSLSEYRYHPNSNGGASGGDLSAEISH